MLSAISNIKASSQELRRVSTLVAAAMLTAVNLVLRLMVVPLSDTIQITFFFLTAAVAGMLFGPVVAGIAGIAGDVITYFLRPTGPFFIGFTLNAFLLGFIYGLFFYRQKFTLRRVILAKLCVIILIDLCLTPIWLNIMYGASFMGMLPARLLKCAILFPVESAMIFGINTVVRRMTVKFTL